MRAPYQILAIPFRLGKQITYCVLHRSDCDQWQFVAGGGEDGESHIETAIREISEEVGVRNAIVTKLTSSAYIPVNVIGESLRTHWSQDIYVIPEYHFAFECKDEVLLSHEHDDYRWLTYDEAVKILHWDSNRTALYEINQRLLAK